MFDDSIEVLVYPTTTVRGRPVPDYTAAPAAATVAGVDVQPGPSSELVAQQREGVAVRYTVFERAPFSVAITAGSVVRVDGGVYQVDGRPQDWRGNLGHRVIALIDWAAS